MSNSWWANKLGNQPPQQAQNYLPPVAPQAPVQQQPPGQPAQRLPSSAQSYDRCPNCASGNYGKMPGFPEAKARCYDCGYPLTQSGTGMPGMHIPSNGNTVAATQINTANNFNPNVIIDRIG